MSAHIKLIEKYLYHWDKYQIFPMPRDNFSLNKFQTPQRKESLKENFLSMGKTKKLLPPNSLKDLKIGHLMKINSCRDSASEKSPI